jgi:poly(A) polymerase
MAQGGAGPKGASNDYQGSH